MSFRFVQRTNFVTFSQDGAIEELFCKVCGSAIGGMQESIKGRRMTAQGSVIEERVLRFRRLHNYAELKMQFDDGSFHVTNGCSTCLHDGLTLQQLQELHIADMDEQEGSHTEPAKSRLPVGIVLIRKDGGGIT